MFEVGKSYEFRIIEGGEEKLIWGKVERYEHPLVKLEDEKPITVQFVTSLDIPAKEETIYDGAPGRIINVTSANFIGAQLRPEKS
ncbi:hypothetical protein [Rhizobium rhizogenes]|uniref:hypothetical protein n=1 Tax=Rhizobium rhizogenes TaxID=359 RepID=UPI0022700857|nr:hypothetical protein [Rhizobium rhizogenes]